jgi:phospholipid transport system substrate-binding protein
LVEKFDLHTSLTCKTIIAALLLAFSGALATAGASESAGDPQQAVRGLIESITQLQSADDPAARARVAESINGSLALGDVSAQALGPDWSRLDEGQRAQFTGLLAELLERLAYPQASQFFSALKTEYRGEEHTPRGTVVRTSVARPDGGALAIDYLLVNSEGRWKVADVDLDGQSLAQSISGQIRTILEQSSYETLLQQMRARLAQPSP